MSRVAWISRMASVLKTWSGLAKDTQKRRSMGNCIVIAAPIIPKSPKKTKINQKKRPIPTAILARRVHAEITKPTLSIAKLSRKAKITKVTSAPGSSAPVALYNMTSPATPKPRVSDANKLDRKSVV